MEDQVFMITNKKLMNYCKAAVMISQGEHTVEDLNRLESKFGLDDDKIFNVYRAVREMKERGQLK